MRAICEECDLFQPHDWKPGDFCVHCGKSVRREVRCFWCANWTPEGKFCRECGAETVDDASYGAARMLKNAGTDRFTVPKMLRELDPDQVENFTRIYQRHAAIVARHVDDLLYLEQFTFHKGFATALEDRLTRELPWPEDKLKAYSIPPRSDGNDAQISKSILDGTPFSETRTLAALNCVRFEDWSAWDYAMGGINAADVKLREEAALVLTGWRTLYGIDLDSRRNLYLALDNCSLKGEALVRRALLGEDVEVPRDLLDSKNPDTAFAAALALGDIERLKQGLNGDLLQQLAAGAKLASLGILAPLNAVLVGGYPDNQVKILRSIPSKMAAPELRETLSNLIFSSSLSVKNAAAAVLCREADNIDVLRVAQAGRSSSAIYQSLLQAETLRSEDAFAVGAFMIENGDFKMSQYGLSTLATSGKMPSDFVVRQFQAADEATRKELCRFAEEQLGAKEDEELHRFMVNVALGPYPSAVRTEAWCSLHRWYRTTDYDDYGPLKISPEPIARFFGSMPVFLERLIEVVDDRVGLELNLYYEFIAKLLKYHDEAALPLFVAEERLTKRLQNSLVEILRDQNQRIDVRCACADLLGLFALHDEWLVEIGRILQGFMGTDMEGACTIVLDRISRPYEKLGSAEELENHQVEVVFDYREKFEEEALKTLNALEEDDCR